MTQPEKALSDRKSGQEVAKHEPGPSRFTAAYWKEKVFRPTYTRDGESREVSQWYARFQVAGRREKVGLNTNSKDEAARRAVKVYNDIRARGWEAALAEFDPSKAEKTDCATVGDFLTAVESAGSGYAPRTLKGYVSSFRWIVAAVFGVEGDRKRFDYKGDGNRLWREKIDRKRMDSLTPERIQHAIDRYIVKAGSSPLAIQTATRSVASVARQARALFAPKMVKKLPFKRLNNPFAGIEIEGAKVNRYAGTVNAQTLFGDARKELAESDPEAYKAFILALGAGLRRKEIDLLQWQQIDPSKNEIRIQTNEYFGTKTEDSEDKVFIDPGLVSELLRYRDASTDLFILEGGPPKPEASHAYYRAAKTFKRLTVWLRGKGVMGNKPLHTLRKEFGSMIAATADIHTASRQLRHSSIQTASDYYLDHRRKISVPLGAWMGENPAAESNDKAEG